MATHVNIGEAKTRLSELVAAAVGGEEVVLDKAGIPQVRLVATATAVSGEDMRLAAQRERALGMFDAEAKGFDLSLRALKSDRSDPDERYRLKFDAAD